MLPTRVLLVDDDPLVRAGVRFLLDSADDLEVVGEAADGDEVVSAVKASRPDVVLMDLIMRRVDGVAATAAVRALQPPPHVIVLTTWDVDDAVVRSIEAGASGFILKSSSRELIAAIRAVMAGDAVLSPKSTRQLLEQWRSKSNEGADHARTSVGRLTEREREVAAATAEGLTNNEIGKRLFLADATVKTHLASIQTKLGLRNRTQVAVTAALGGLVSEQ